MDANLFLLGYRGSETGPDTALLTVDRRRCQCLGPEKLMAICAEPAVLFRVFSYPYPGNCYVPPKEEFCRSLQCGTRWKTAKHLHTINGRTPHFSLRSMSSRNVLPPKSSNKIILPSPGNYSGALHNYMQEKKELHLLSWAEIPSLTSNQALWTVHCKIGGEIKGTGVASQKAVAKQAAAKQACESLALQ